MAILNITGAKELARDQTGQYVPVRMTGATVQEITGITATPQSSSAFQPSTGFIRLYSDIAIRYALGTNPTAGATSTPLAADVLEIIGISRNKNIIISVRTF